MTPSPYDMQIAAARSEIYARYENSSKSDPVSSVVIEQGEHAEY